MGRVTRGIKRIVKPIVNFPAWMSMEYLRTSKNYLFDLAKELFTIEKSSEADNTITESFDHALQRLNITPDKLNKQIRSLTTLVRIYFFLFSAMMLYDVYLLTHAYWRAAFIATGVATLILAMWFRVHFWRFQMQQRKLGCGFLEWFNYGLLQKR